MNAFTNEIIMRSSFSIIFVCLILLFSNLTAFAQPSQPQTRFYIIKTNRLLGVAHMTVKRTQKFTGDLALAVRHERKALALYEAKDFTTAIYHSKRCRTLCLKIFSENKIKLPMDAKYTADEEALAAQSPSDDVLDKNLENTELKDQDFMNGNMQVDIK